MRNRKQIILESMDSMLASAQIEGLPGITLKKFLLELEFLVEYPKEGEAGKFSPGQIRYIKRVLDDNYKVGYIDNQRYYYAQGLLI